jgi:glycosyltransferase involved in cell wall biosynthesis
MHRTAIFSAQEIFLGYVTVEAMSLNNSVVAAGVCGLREIMINGRTGLLVKPGNVK